MAVGTSGLDKTRMMILEKGPNDEHAQDNSDSNTTSTTFQDKLSLVFTPPSAGDYLILAGAGVKNATSLRKTAVRLLDNGTSTGYGDNQSSFQNTTDWHPWYTQFKINLAASSQTFKLQWSAVAIGTAHIREATIIAIRLDHHRPPIGYAENLTNASTSNTTYVDRTTLTHTPENTFQMILGAMFIESQGFGAQNNNVAGRVIEGATPIVMVENIHRPSVRGGTWPVLALKRQETAESSTTWKTQWKRFAGPSAHIKDSSIITVDMDDRRVL